MVPRARRYLVVTALVLFFALAVGSARPASAADVFITLYADATLGWGLSNTSMSKPGPDLTVTIGDNVTLTLNGTDNANHRWFIDFDNDTTVDGDEPASRNFRAEQITWNFTANRTGTFAYRDRFNAAELWGNITIEAAGATPPTVGSGTLLLIGGIAAGFVALLAFATFLMRRKQT